MSGRDSKTSLRGRGSGSLREVSARFQGRGLRRDRETRSLSALIDWPSLAPVICFAESVRTGTTNHSSLILRRLRPSLLSALLISLLA